APLRRINRDEGTPARHPANHLEHLIDRYARAPANIVYAAWDAPGGSGDRGADGVAHEGEIAGLFAVSVNGNRLTEERRPQKLIKAHVGPRPRPVDGKISYGDRRQAIIDVVEIAELLGCQLRHAVRRHGLRQRVFAHWHGHVVTVYRGARRIDQPLE